MVIFLIYIYSLLRVDAEEPDSLRLTHDSVQSVSYGHKTDTKTAVESTICSPLENIRQPFNNIGVCSNAHDRDTWNLSDSSL